MTLRPVLLLLAALALVGCGANNPEIAAPENQSTAAAEAGTQTETRSTAPAASGPEISGTSLDGEALSVADFRGTPLFVNVWSSW